MPIGYCVVLFAFVAAHPIPFETGAKWGYRDNNGKPLIQPRFTVATEFSREGLAAVVDELGWAYIDTSGKVVIRPMVVDNGPDAFNEGLARFPAAERVGFFNRRGKVVIEPAFSFALPFSDGLAAVCSVCRPVPDGEHTRMAGGPWGFIDNTGRLRIPLQFDEVHPFAGGKARVRSGGSWKVIDRAGRYVLSP